MSKRPLILATNDDGIFAPGLKNLVEVVKDFGEVLVVAPDKPQSGMGHAITVNNFLRLSRVDYMPEITAYSCSGTPVDCVKLAIYSILKRKPDFLVSGINHGSNSSINVLYSGTMSAAVEGALEGIPSVGFSLQDFSLQADFSVAQDVTKIVVKNALERGIPDSTCLNVNIPVTDRASFKGLRVCRQAKANWEDEFESRKDPFGREYYWLAGAFKNFDHGEDTDEWALNHNFASVVPIQYDMTAHHAMTPLNEWNFNDEN